LTTEGAAVRETVVMSESGGVCGLSGLSSARAGGAWIEVAA